MATEEERAQYDIRYQLAIHVANDLRQRIQNTLRALGDPFLVRARVSGERIKSLDSMLRKARDFGWSFEEALKKARDIVGFRIVCNNVQDVFRTADLLCDSLKQNSFKVRVDDYVRKPKPDGYRALHLSFYYAISMGTAKGELGCEIQVRSLLQDPWAVLSREDIYASATAVSAGVLRRMHALSGLLAKADGVADAIRTNLARPRKGRQQHGEITVLSVESLAFVYRRAFDEDPPEYLVQSVVRDYGGSSVRTDGVEAALKDREFVGRLQDAYHVAARWDADNTQLFRWAIHSVIHGTDAAIRQARRDGRVDWHEVDTIARREMLACLPDDPDSVLEDMRHSYKDEDPEGKVENWARALESIHHRYCGAELIDAEDLADKLVRRFKLRGRKADDMRHRIERAVYNSAVEVQSWEHPSTCGYCHHQISKDD